MRTQLDVPIWEFVPNWSEDWEVGEAESQLVGFKFSGPGWYINEYGNTLLVVPVSYDSNQEIIPNPWSAVWPASQLFRFFAYSRNPASAFNAIANAPTRKD